jgi:hypothetical protein
LKNSRMLSSSSAVRRRCTPPGKLTADSSSTASCLDPRSTRHRFPDTCTRASEQSAKCTSLPHAGQPPRFRRAAACLQHAPDHDVANLGGISAVQAPHGDQPVDALHHATYGGHQQAPHGLRPVTPARCASGGGG